MAALCHAQSSRSRSSSQWSSGGCGSTALPGAPRRIPRLLTCKAVFPILRQVLVERQPSGGGGGGDGGAALMGLGPGSQLQVSEVLGRGCAAPPFGALGDPKLETPTGGFLLLPLCSRCCNWAAEVTGHVLHSTVHGVPFDNDIPCHMTCHITSYIISYDT